MVLKAKQNFISKIILDCKENNKKLFDTTSDLCEDGKQNQLPKTKNDQELANEFLDYYTNKIETIRSNLQHHWMPTIS